MQFIVSCITFFCIFNGTQTIMSTIWYNNNRANYSSNDPSFIEKYFCIPKVEEERCRKVFFYPSNEMATFLAAKSRCRQRGMRLVSITTKETWETLKPFLAKNNGRAFWTSAYRVRAGRDEFAWDTGCPLAFTNWAPGEPNNLKYRPENCVEIRKDWKWNDEPCGRLKFYICEEIGCW